MECFRCRTEMQKTIFESVLVDYCPECKGFWLDGGEFERALNDERFDVEKSFAEAKMEKAQEGSVRPSDCQCPRCVVGQLKPFKRSNVRLDQCDGCNGIFFDQGELDALFNAEKLGFFGRFFAHVRGLI